LLINTDINNKFLNFIKKINFNFFLLFVFVSSFIWVITKFSNIYKLNNELAIVQTIDFFPPVVDDPYLYGKIAAVNALSDIYCMGAKPITALNVFAVPEDLDEEYLIQILQGGNDAAKEAGTVIIGGHTIIDKEPKYGLSVTGTINPNNIISSSDAKIGDNIILTKKIGTGIILTAEKNYSVSTEIYKEAIDSMIHLNKNAAAIALKNNVNAMTDVTGFGLSGHLINVAKASDVSILLRVIDVPLFSGFNDLISKNISTGGADRNFESFSMHIDNLHSYDSSVSSMLFDPQTSGGLLLFVDSKNTMNLLDELIDAGEYAEVIGEVIKKDKSSISLI